MAQVVAGATATGSTAADVPVTVIVAREMAIAAAIAGAAAEDVVLLAGKGHEPYQEINGVRHPFSDIEHARESLAAWRQS